MPPMPTTVMLESFTMRLISITDSSLRMAVTISLVEASSGAGMRYSLMLKMFERVLGR